MILDMGCSVCVFFFFFQAEYGIRYAQESRGLGDLYKRQAPARTLMWRKVGPAARIAAGVAVAALFMLSLIHI